jgi:hypothetical protein
MAGSCIHGNLAPGSVKAGNFLGQLSDATSGG